MYIKDTNHRKIYMYYQMHNLIQHFEPSMPNLYSDNPCIFKGLYNSVKMFV